MKQLNSRRESADVRRGADLSKGYAAVFATVVIWSLPSLFMYYLNRFYDPWAQNFYRYSVACIAIAPLVLYRMRGGGPRIDMRAIRLCFLPCLPNVIHQVTQVMALFYMGPGVYAIFTRASVIFTALLALAFFPEERFVIRRDLVSGQRAIERTTYRVAWIVHRFYRNVLLGALRCSD